MTNRDRALVFLVALLVRGVVAWIFFGSVDLTNAMLYTARLFDGAPPSTISVPYLPGAYQLVLWLSGVLAIETAMPLAFAYKLFPLVFDAAIAVLVHDTRGRRTGLLYAFAPVPIIVTVIHVQWDAIAFELLLFALLIVARRPALAGAALVLSVLVKPLALPFVPLLFTKDRRAAIATASGMAACIAGYVIVLYAIGDPLTWTAVKGVVYYARWGVQVFGLPVITGGHVNRLLTLLPLLLLVPLYWKGRITRIDAVTLSLAFILASSGIAPQYLLWIVPLLLIGANRRYAALYSLAAGLFLLIYYHHPGPDGFNYENLGAFAPLRSMSWLAPATTNTTNLLVFLGSIMIPVSALVFFTMQLFKAVRMGPAEERWPPVSIMPTALATAVVLIAFLVPSEPTGPRFNATVQVKTAQYAMDRYHGPGLRNPHEPSWVIHAYTREHHRSSPVNAVSIGYAWVVLWSVAAWMAR